MNKIEMIFRLLLGAFMIYVGVFHLTFNRLKFMAQVPTWLRFSEGFADFVMPSSGVVEVALGLSMLFLCGHKAVIGALFALFFVLIFPGNLNRHFYHIDPFGLDTDAAHLIRLFFQSALIAWVLWSTGGWQICKQ